MKMTFDLPADVVQRLRLKAAHEGLKLKDLLAEACRHFLSKPAVPRKQKRSKSPFPIIKGGKPPKPGMELTPEKVDELLWGSSR